MMIQTKARETLKFGRFRVHVDDFAKLVRVEPAHNAPAPSHEELTAVHKYLCYQRPRQFSEVIHTGWAIESVIDC